MSSANYAIRKATEADNEALIDLARRCPMKAQLEMYSDRYPDFFAMNRLQGKAHVYLAEDEAGKVVGCVALTEKEELRGGRHVKTLHIGDLRTDPSLRRSSIAARFIRIYMGMLQSGEFDHGLVEILEGNNAAVGTHSVLTEDFSYYPEGKINLFQLVPVRSYGRSKDFQFRKASDEDIPQIVELLKANYAGAAGAPDFSVEWFKGELAKHPSFQLSDIHLAVDRSGEIVAAAGLWDQSPVRRWVATKFSSSIKGAVRLMSFLGLLWRLPPTPKEYSALSFAYIRWPVAKAGRVDALQALLKFLMRKVREEHKHQFVSIGFHDQDPLKASLDGLTKVQENTQVFSHWITGSDAHKQNALPPGALRFVDVALI